MNDSRKVALYLAVVFALAYAAEFYIVAHGGVDGPAMRRLAPAVMFVPGVTAVVLLIATGEGLGSIAWKLPRPSFLAWGILLPAACSLVCFAAITRLGIGTSPHIPRLSARVTISGGTFVLGRGEQSLPWFLLNFAATAAVLSLLSGLVTVGEEIGWRGFLQPRLVRRFGNAGGIALLGFVWAHWHTPLVLNGFNYPATPRLGAWVLWPATCIFMSFMLGWLSINGESVWPAVLAHGCFNSLQGGLVDGIVYPTAAAHLRGDLVSLGVFLAAGIACLAATRRPGTPVSIGRAAS